MLRDYRDRRKQSPTEGNHPRDPRREGNSGSGPAGSGVSEPKVPSGAPKPAPNQHRGYSGIFRDASESLPSHLQALLPERHLTSGQVGEGKGESASPPQPNQGRSGKLDMEPLGGVDD
jgi:hypothetical protein